jgi:hypothetical protein
MTADVSVPYPDYSVPVQTVGDRVGVTVVDGYLLIGDTDRLIITHTAGGTHYFILVRGGSEAQSYRLDVSVPDYMVPVPKPDWT